MPGVEIAFTRRKLLAGVTAAGTLSLLPELAQSDGAWQRQDATTLATDASKVAKLEGAVREMMDRSRANASDPRGWLVNAKAHADFCSLPGTAAQQIHFCWWFLPWHRAYLAITERKLREIASEPGLCLPYWNWSTDRRIPALFARAESPLAAAVRFTRDGDVLDSEVDYNPDDPVLSKLGVSALGSRVFQAASRQEIGGSFGGIARPNPQNAYGNNRLEGTPHGPIHNYVGGESPTDPNRVGDMSDFTTAGRDPVFFAHHANLDRLWEIWRQDPAHKASEPTDEGFRKHAFHFTWLDGSVVSMTVEDVLDTAKLGYTYDSLDVFRPVPTRVAERPRRAQPADLLPPVVSAPATVQIAPGLRSARGARLVLRVEDVRLPPRPITLVAYVQPADAPAGTQQVEVGSFAAPTAGGNVGSATTDLEFDVTAAVRSLGTENLRVQLVPISLGSRRAYEPLEHGAVTIVAEAPP